jgi:hypothetical protein
MTQPITQSALRTLKIDPSNPYVPKRRALRIGAFMVVVSGLVISDATYAVNLATNGSFEAPSIVATNTFALYNTGSTQIAGWTVIGGQIAALPDTYVLGWNASEGRQYVDLTGISGFDKGIRSDSIQTIVGTQYTVSFAVGNFGALSTLVLSINGGTEELFTNTTMPPFGQLRWMNFTTSWTATADSAQLSFVGRANGSLSNIDGIGIDNVVFAPVPEPATSLFLLSGLAMLALARRRTSLHRESTLTPEA